MRIAANEYTLPRLHLIGTLTIVMLLTLALGGYFSWRSAQDHQASIERVGQVLHGQQQERLQRELDSAISFLEFTRQRTDSVLRASLREQVDVAMQIVQAIHDRESQRHPPDVVKRMIIEALRPVRFYQGRGYYFIDDLQGRFILLPTAPQLEGQLRPDNQDDRGHFIMRGLVEAARLPDGQGYSSYRWYLPDKPKEMAEKLAYVRYFAAYDWLIGTGDYTAPWEQQQQLAVLERLRAVRFGQSGVITVADQDGRLLLSNGRPDLQGLPLQALPPTEAQALQQLLAKARAGGGFVRYQHADAGGKLLAKTALVRRVESWGWTVMVTIADNELQGTLQRELALRNLSGQLPWLTVLVPLALALSLGLVASWAFSRWSAGLFASYHHRLRSQTDLLAQSEALFRAFFENAAFGMAQVAPDGRFLQINQRFCDLLGYPRDAILPGPFTFQQVTVPEDIEADMAQVQRLLRGEANSYQLEKRYLRIDGRIVWVALAVTLMRQPDGSPDFFVSAAADITERRQAQERLQLAANVFTHAREAIMITELDGRIIDVNDSFERITGYSRAEALGQNPRLLKSGHQSEAFYLDMWQSLMEKGHWEGETWNRRKDGAVCAELQTISLVRDAAGQPRHYVSLFSDITALKEHERQLERIAHFDALTGLPNRVLLADRLAQAMLQTQRRGQLLAVAYLDLDGFKTINDQHGHEAGDHVLMGVATRMKDALREGDTLARLGGDEFVAVLVDLPDMVTCQALLTRLLEAAAEPLTFDGQTLRVSASLGVTVYPQAEAIDADQLQRQADQAMYHAKLAGKNRYHVFDADQDRSARGYFESLEHIRHALHTNELLLHYQPKVNMRSGQVIGAEALIRWQHPQSGLLMPAQFLPVIDDHPLAIEVGEWVIDSALGQLQRWRTQGLDIQVSVNVGARQMQQRDFVARLQQILTAHPDIAPNRLALEVLETSALEDIEGASAVIEACRVLGVSFALDDFGTGYSSLTYLKRLPVALLKIDQSFVRGMLDDPDDLAILKGVIGLAQAFHREVIAEGVETVAHGVALLQLGCELAQGYGVARPMPGDHLPDWVAHWQPDPAWQQV